MSTSAGQQSRRVFLGVAGGAACFKAVALASLMAREGWELRVAMTKAACAFVQPLSFTAVTRTQVILDSLQVDPDSYPSHLRAMECDAMVLLPGTADLLAKIAHGMADDAVTLAAILAPELRFFCPAMNDRMWENAFVQENVQILEAHGWRRIGPECGRLAEGYEGMGRMTEPEQILQQVRDALQSQA